MNRKLANARVLGRGEILVRHRDASELASPGEPHRRYLARFVRAGRAQGPDGAPANFAISTNALADAQRRGEFDGKAVFLDHAGLWEYPSLDNLVGWTAEASWDGEAVVGVIELLNRPGAQEIADVLDELLALGAGGPDVGLSLVFYPRWGPPGADGVRQVAGIRKVESVDLVFGPAADGRVLQALSAVGWVETRNPTSNPGVGWVEARNPTSNPGVGWVEARNPTSNPGVGWVEARNPTFNSDNEREESMENQDELQVETERAATTHAEGTTSANTGAWIAAIQAAGSRALIDASGLPQAARQRLAGVTYPTPGALSEAIEAERRYLGTLYADQVVQIGGLAPRGAHITGMLDSLDRLGLALDALMLGTRPPDGIQPLTGIREAYHLLSGDYEMNGVFQPERVLLANVNSSTMAGLVANALNKRLVNEFQSYPQWWAPIVSIEDFTTLQSVRWITLGGVGELPTVAEGAAYTELTWDDSYETASFVKKGGYLGITLEAIDKDDVGRLRAAPRALAQAAWLTLSKSISSIFTTASGAGPNLVDGTALFHSSRGNVGTSALSVSAFAAVRTAMRKFTELNSGERLGALTAPRTLLVPPDLETTALQVLASEHDYTYALSNGVAAPPNVEAAGDTFQARINLARQRVIVVDLWTDSNDWAAVANPQLYPTIGLGFRYGRAPEIFSVASPTAGLMFANDTMPVKARFFYATGPMDWRGMFKQNV